MATGAGGPMILFVPIYLLQQVLATIHGVSERNRRMRPAASPIPVRLMQDSSQAFMVEMAEHDQRHVALAAIHQRWGTRFTSRRLCILRWSSRPCIGHAVTGSDYCDRHQIGASGHV